MLVMESEDKDGNACRGGDSEEVSRIEREHMPRTADSKRISRVAAALVGGGVTVFGASFWWNVARDQFFWGDLLELLGTAGMVFGAYLVVRGISRSRYTPGIFLLGCISLTLARFVDFTQEISALEGVPLVGSGAYSQFIVLRASESVGYICILLTMLALMYELSKTIDAVEAEGRRYKSLLQASQYLARVADRTADAVFAVDPDGAVQVWNKGAERLFGYSKDEAAQLTLYGLLPEGMEAAGDNVLNWVLQFDTHRAIDVVARRKDGTRFHAGATFAIVENEDGKPVGTSVVVRDIEERKEAERKLIESRNLLSGALRAADVGIFIVDRAGGVVEFNSQVQDLVGLSRQVIEQGTIRTLAPLVLEDPDTFITSLYERVLEKGKHVELRNLRVVRPDGTLRVCNGGIAPVLDENGAIIAAASVVIDTTEREALQARLLEAQKMDSIGRLAGGVAHDFNNILTGILGYASLGREIADPRSPLAKHLAAIEESAVRASELTHQLLTFARGGARKELTVSLNRIVDETVKLLAHSVDPNIQIRFNAQDGVDLVSADPAQMHQMLVNLCLNARDAVNGKGEIDISIENVDLTEERPEKLGVAMPGRYVRVRVEDNGCGMTPEVAQRVFEPFFSTKKQGQAYGLGLSVVYGIVHAHRGAITVDSEPGKGTRIEVYLPSAGRDYTPAPRADREVHEPRAGATILVVDDEKLLRAVLQDILEMSGYRVLQASTGEEAIEIYRERRDEIELVILDVVMPGMGGPRALEALLELNPRLRCVVSSGYGGDAIEQQYVNTNIRFVPKPFNVANVTRAVQELLHA